MLYAVNVHGEIVRPTPSAKGKCPSCNGPVTAKCGPLVTHHWSHVAKDCDPWSEPESEWHRNWKSLFPKECCEVVIGNHRADVKINEVVIEFQKSPISVEEIAERESHYGEMIWVLNGNDFLDRLTFFDGSEVCRRKLSNFDIVCTEESLFSAEPDKRKVRWIAFDWSRCRRTWSLAKRPVFIDLPLQSGDYIFEILEFPHNHTSPVGFVPSKKPRWSSRYGCGRAWPKSEFVRRQIHGSYEFGCPFCRATALIKSHVGVLSGQVSGNGTKTAKAHTPRVLARLAGTIVATHVQTCLFYAARSSGTAILSSAAATWINAVASVIEESFDDDVASRLMERRPRWLNANLDRELLRRDAISSEAVGIAAMLARCNSIQLSDRDECFERLGVCGRHSTNTSFSFCVTDEGVSWNRAASELPCQ